MCAKTHLHHWEVFPQLSFHQISVVLHFTKKKDLWEPPKAPFIWILFPILGDSVAFAMWPYLERLTVGDLSLAEGPSLAPPVHPEEGRCRWT